MKTQKDRVLEALQKGPLTTGQLHAIPYIVNSRARVSELRKEGHIITVTPIKNSDSSTYTYKGLFPHVSMVRSEKEMFGGFDGWRVVSEGLECLEIGGRL